MNVPAKLAAFGALSAIVFTAALGVGAAVGPIETPTGGSHVTSVDMNHKDGAG